MNKAIKFKMSSIFRPGIGSLAVKIAQVGSAFLLSVVLARTLGAEQYGVYAFCLSVVSFVAVPAQLGLPPLVVRETAKALHNQDFGLMKGVWSWSNGYVIKISAILLLVSFAVLLSDSIIFDETTLVVLMLGFFVVPIVSLAKIRGASLQGLSRVILGQLPEAVIRPCLMIIAVGVSYFFALPVEYTAINTMALHLSAAIVAYIFGALVLYGAKPGILKVVTPKKDAIKWRRSVLPLALIGGVQLINGQFDIIMLGVMRSSEEVGVYRVVNQMGVLVVFALSAITMALQPSFARLHEKQDLASLQSLVTHSARIIFLLALVPAIIYYFWGEWVLGAFFGEEFSVGYWSVLILTVGQLFNAVVGSVGALLNMTGYERDSLTGLVISACFNVLGNLILIPLYGIEGAAMATAGSVVICNIVLWSFVKKRLGINSFAFANIKRVAA